MKMPNARMPQEFAQELGPTPFPFLLGLLAVLVVIVLLPDIVTFLPGFFFDD